MVHRAGSLGLEMVSLPVEAASFTRSHWKSKREQIVSRRSTQAYRTVIHGKYRVPTLTVSEGLRTLSFRSIAGSSDKVRRAPVWLLECAADDTLVRTTVHNLVFTYGASAQIISSS